MGLKRGTVKLLPHDSGWDVLYNQEKEKLLKVLDGQVLNIQHVGSTAIPIIMAKPIVDIAILVKSLKKIDAGELETLGYQKKEENRIERMFFTKGPEENRIIYLHIGDKTTNYIQDMIIFRDYLIRNPEEAKNYEKLKQELAEKFSDNREQYTLAKENFVQEIVRRCK